MPDAYMKTTSNPGWEGLSDQSGGREVMLNKDLIFKRVAGDAITKAKTMPKKMEELAKKTASARETLEKAVTGIGESMEEVKPLCSKYLKDLGYFRGQAHDEVIKASKEIKALRALFMSTDYDREMERLKEYIDVCERLAALKKEGILDDVSETLLKLAK